ncbi:Nif3-like dinuclear metal center hexameric protein [Candidatus Ishikawella capsulata]|uniref:GTP cyclohydrolase 1 type 2 homolog n=1 Tax=Candidatus Ishikawaella capsulata Mpkobe TaxID=476281 RepID=C5WDD6_9ENTR|nr:Nif3-like dinuclear metal center hexameric protein [Candidatus Ishikawaella capsulata]BAH83342.1 conserved metal-binding protein [Candidatus Ishikawaella capsulata Mpkobe]
MKLSNLELEYIINQKLNSDNVNDYVPNGLQVEGRSYIKNIITGVTACQALLNEAVKLNADAIIVHHGYFWKNEAKIIKGMKRTRLKTLLFNNINLYSWHLPLDMHSELGNNVQLAKLLNINIAGEIMPLVLWGELVQQLKVSDFLHYITQNTGSIPIYCGNNKSSLIKRIAWSCGSGQKFIDDAVNFGIDAFCSGEISEQTVHSAREQDIHYFAIGHHNSECGGIKALGNWLAEKYQLNVTFINIPNPA